MYLLEIIQGERTHQVGIFANEAATMQFIAQVPFVNKESYAIDEQVFTDYTMNFADLPEYTEVVFENHRYIISRYMFEPDEPIFFNWYAVQNFAQAVSQPTLFDGATRVDAYSVANEDVESYIAQRNALVAEIEQALGEKVVRAGMGSEDGEYVLHKDHFLCHLDPQTLEQRKEAENITDFLQQITQ